MSRLSRQSIFRLICSSRVRKKIVEALQQEMGFTEDLPDWYVTALPKIITRGSIPCKTDVVVDAPLRLGQSWEENLFHGMDRGWVTRHPCFHWLLVIFKRDKGLNLDILLEASHRLVLRRKDRGSIVKLVGGISRLKESQDRVRQREWVYLRMINPPNQLFEEGKIHHYEPLEPYRFILFVKGCGDEVDQVDWLVYQRFLSSCFNTDQRVSLAR